MGRNVNENNIVRYKMKRDAVSRETPGRVSHVGLSITSLLHKTMKPTTGLHSHTKNDEDLMHQTELCEFAFGIKSENMEYNKTLFWLHELQ